MGSAFYSVVQFCPNLARGEGVNVGVVIVSPRREPRTWSRASPRTTKA